MTAAAERIAQLRKLMAERGIDAYVIPMADFHQSEYVGEHFKAIRFVTGFLVHMRLWPLPRIRLVCGPMADTLLRFSQNVRAVASSS